MPIRRLNELHGYKKQQHQKDPVEENSATARPTSESKLVDAGVTTRILKIPIIIHKENDEFTVSCPLLTSEEKGKDLNAIKINMLEYFRQLARDGELNEHVGQFDYLEIEI